MKNLKWVIFCIYFITVHAQGQVKFIETKNPEELFEKAKNENKLIFLQFMSEDCQQCNKIAEMALNSPILNEKFNTSFVSAYISNEEQHHKIKDIIHFDVEYGSIFVDPTGQVLLIKGITTSNIFQYIQWADKAIKLSQNSKDLINMRIDYNDGNRSPGFLKKYISLLRGLDIFDQVLMDDYISSLSINEIKKDENILFFKEQGMSAFSISYKIINLIENNRTSDSLWFTLDEKTRISINNRIRMNTFQDVVSKKDKNLLYKLRSLTMAQFSSNWKSGDYVSSKYFIDFYKKTKDTTNYLATAVQFAEMHLMKYEPDSLQIISEAKKMSNEIVLPSEPNPSFENRIAMKAPPTWERISKELNNISYSVCTMTNNQEMIEKALLWSKRSMDLWDAGIPNPEFKNPAYLDTYAHLLYKIGKKEDAISYLEKAIKCNKKMKIPDFDPETKLELMKTGKLK